ncbi:iron-sulfur cluster assembly protein 1 [Phtheirospermum japonicum]|uniref:Iron-sulfur cluster assembly protein 1 n=1 Tax=Phtheirospermum japonicum TaxID=374723 RepID=A0A830CWC6_9LAMI|nr:iron-sulfur cluster assembly protein 1 [Phtheirospermum japonicum]
MLRHVTNKILGQGMRSPAVPALRMYHERVDHYSNSRNIGSFDKSDPNVRTGLVGAPACGDVMKLKIKFDEVSRKIVDACFKTFGCGSAIDSSSVGMCCDHEWGFN